MLAGTTLPVCARRLRVSRNVSRPRTRLSKSTGLVWNCLSQKQAQALLNTPDSTKLKGLRDRAIIAVLLGCGLRRSEVAALTMAHVIATFLVSDAGEEITGAAIPAYGLEISRDGRPTNRGDFSATGPVSPADTGERRSP
jgi:hypothetical protein